MSASVQTRMAIKIFFTNSDWLFSWKHANHTVRNNNLIPVILHGQENIHFVPILCFDWRRALWARCFVVRVLLEYRVTHVTLQLLVTPLRDNSYSYENSTCRLWARVPWWLTLSALFSRKFSVRSTRTTRNRLKLVAMLSRFPFSERDAANI